MRKVFLVQPQEADLARRVESKLINTPLASGILFVGVTVIPPTDTVPSSVYRVWIGCHRDFDETLLDPLVRVLLAEEIHVGMQLVVEAHRGLSRSAVKSC